MFDWAFVLIYLLPLVVIALGHDLVTGERETGRLRLLLSLNASAIAGASVRGFARISNGQRE